MARTDTVASPLHHIEQAVQDEANRRALDAGTEEGRAVLRSLVDRAVQDWNDGTLSGGTDRTRVDTRTLSDRAFRNLVAYGPLTELLEDDDVWEIMVNSPDRVFVRRHRGRSGLHPEVFHDDDHVARTLTKLLEDAGTGSRRKLDPSEGLQDAQLADGARLHIVHGELSRGGHILVNIRKFTGVAITSLDQLVARGSLTREVAGFLQAAVRSQLSIVFAGAPGSGKTTLLSCCAAELDPLLRVVVAEEVFEADIPVANLAGMQTRPARVDREEVDLRRLVSGFLRMAPDVAIVGEVRDREALPLLLTLSSGVTGYTTIHAATARQALTRLRFVAQLAEAARSLPLGALNSLVTDAVDLVVHTERTRGGPVVSCVLAVEELAGGQDAMQFTTTELFSRSPDGELEWTGLLPIRAADRLARHGVDVRELLAADHDGRGID